MKRIILFFTALVLVLSFAGCANPSPPASSAPTTAPVPTAASPLHQPLPPYPQPPQVFP